MNKTIRISRKAGFIALIVAAFILLLWNACSVSIVRAEEITERPEEEIIEEIKAHSDSIVRVEAICWDGEENVYETRSFSGFAVSDDTRGIYVVTAYKNLTYTSEEKEDLKIKYKLEENARISEKIEVIFNGDLRTVAEIAGESKQRNLVLLKLNQTVHFENILSFSEKNVSDTERIFLLSFPETSKKEKMAFTKENVVITTGAVKSSYLSNEIVFMKHNIKSDKAAVGGPLLDDNGSVVGMFQTSKGEKDGIAISSESIKAFLDTYNVSYQLYQTESTKKKIPILNLILGVVVVILLLAVIMQKVKNNQHKDGDVAKPSRKSIKKEKRKAADERKKSSEPTGKYTENPMRETANRSVNRSVSLEYPSEKRLVIVRKSPFIIGREKDSDLIISQSKGISRKHACLQFDGKNFLLSDQQSTNGTFLNGMELKGQEKKVLKDGDEIMVGKEKLIFRIK